MMKQDPHTASYKRSSPAIRAFDGIFFVGVTSTGIYCHPICPVKPPKEANCQFYNTAQEAEQRRVFVPASGAARNWPRATRP